VGLVLQSYKCQFHPNNDPVGSCPKCGKHLCSICLPRTDRPCRVCVGYRHAQTLATIAAVTVSIFLGMISPLLGLLGVVVLFYSFRSLFRSRTRAIVQAAGRTQPSTSTSTSTSPSASSIPPSQGQISNLNFCDNCRLWTSNSYCKQCGRKLI
jgi:hypothetical protein